MVSLGGSRNGGWLPLWLGGTIWNRKDGTHLGHRMGRDLSGKEFRQNGRKNRRSTVDGMESSSTMEKNGQVGVEGVMCDRKAGGKGSSLWVRQRPRTVITDVPITPTPASTTSFTLHPLIPVFTSLLIRLFIFHVNFSGRHLQAEHNIGVTT